MRKMVVQRLGVAATRYGHHEHQKDCLLEFATLRFADWCRCCGRLKKDHPVIVGYDQVCAIFMAFDWDDHKITHMSQATPKRKK